MHILSCVDISYYLFAINLYIIEFIMGCCFSYFQNAQDGEANFEVQNSYDQSHQISLSLKKSPQRKESFKTAQEWKLQGNNQFKNKNFTLAIYYYEKAISYPNPDISYYSNLALALKANRKYQQSITIIDTMIRNTSFHSYQNAELFRKGLIIKARCAIIIVKDYCLSGKYSQKQNSKYLLLVQSGINTLQEILSVPNTKNEFKTFLQNGMKVKQFLTQSVMAKSKSERMIEYFNNKFRSHEVQNLQKQSLLYPLYYKSSEDVLEELTKLADEQKMTVLEDSQEYIVDPITYQIFKNPVMTPSGQSYDEDILREHFKNNGYSDPITHEKFKIGDRVVIKNNNLLNYIGQIRKTANKDDLLYLSY